MTMQPRQMNALRRGLNHVFEQGGEQATWYKFITAAAGAAWAGLGGAETFATAQIMLLGRSWDVGTYGAQGEVQALGGRVEQGRLSFLIREPVTPRDRLGYLGNLYDVAGDAEPQSIGGVLLHKVFVKRAGA